MAFRRVPGDHPDLPSAFNASAPGDRIEVTRETLERFSADQRRSAEKRLSYENAAVCGDKDHRRGGWPPADGGRGRIGKMLAVAGRARVWSLLLFLVP